MVLAAALFFVLPTSSFAYTLQQLRHPKAAECRPGVTNLRRSRRLLWREQLAFNDERRDWSGMRVYRSVEHGLSLHFPASWSARERAFGTLVSFLSPPENAQDPIIENINILAQDFPHDRPSLFEYTVGTIAALKAANPGLIFLSSAGISIGSNPAYAVTYDEPSESGTMRFRQVWTIVGGRAYLLTLTATPDTFDEFAPVFDAMMQSMVLTS